jgi:adenosylmethionine---8-amino-7-oxononanoate aminotransferase
MDNTGNTDLTKIDRSNIWHPFTSLTEKNDPILISKAEGPYLITSDGRKIIDAISSWWVNLHGHSNPVIAKAIFEQASSLEHVIFAGFTHEPAIKLSQNLLSILPRNQSKIFFSDNGSTAVEVALKMAIQYWYNKKITKTKIVAFEGAYHGDTFGSMSVGSRSAFTNPFAGYLFDVEFLPVPTDENIEFVKEKFVSLLHTDEVAAFIFEPLVQAAAGMVMYKPEHLDILLKIARSRNVICIADEVFTGFGRTGKLFACNYLENSVDIMALSKGITGGTLPLGVTTCCDEIQKAYLSSDPKSTFFHGHSYTANPVACAAANASFDLLIQKVCQENIERISSQNKQFLTDIQNHRNVREVRAYGTILAIEVRTAEDSSYFNNLKHVIYKYFLARNILLRPLGNVVYIVPPYIIADADLQNIYTSIQNFLDSLEEAVMEYS